MKLYRAFTLVALTTAAQMAPAAPPPAPKPSNWPNWGGNSTRPPSGVGVSATDQVDVSKALPRR